MRKPEARHYTEEEILMCRLGEVSEAMAAEISAHIRECPECAGLFEE